MVDLNHKLPYSLAECQIPGPPDSMYYIADFISIGEEVKLLEAVNSAPLPQWRKLAHRRLQSQPSQLISDVLLDAPLPIWLQWPVDRLATIALNRASAQALGTDSKEPLSHIFSRSLHGRPNHCLVNEYLPGQGIMAHEDGPAYYPITATVSLGSHAILNVESKLGTESASEGEEGGASKWRILCEPRSLLVTSGDAYNTTLHGIEGTIEDSDIRPQNDDEVRTGIANWNLLGQSSAWLDRRTWKRETRISLTYRDVLKVRTLKGLSILRDGRKK